MSNPVKVDVYSKHVDTLDALKLGDASYFSGTAVTCVNEAGQREKGLFVFAYSSKVVTSGAKHGIILFSLVPVRYTIVIMRNSNDCKPVHPVEKCSPPIGSASSNYLS